jgi:G-patch domain
VRRRREERERRHAAAGETAESSSQQGSNRKRSAHELERDNPRVASDSSGSRAEENEDGRAARRKRSRTVFEDAPTRGPELQSLAGVDVLVQRDERRESEAKQQKAKSLTEKLGMAGTVDRGVALDIVFDDEDNSDRRLGAAERLHLERARRQTQEPSPGESSSGQNPGPLSGSGSGSGGGPSAPSEALRLDVARRPEGPDLDTYSRVPVAEFGAAMLRAIGWAGPGAPLNPEDSRGTVAVPVEPVRRPGRVGLGTSQKRLEELRNELAKGPAAGKSKTASSAIPETDSGARPRRADPGPETAVASRPSAMSEPPLPMSSGGENGDGRGSWIVPDLIVRIVSKALSGGRFFRRKARILESTGSRSVAQLLDNADNRSAGIANQILSDVRTRDFETVLPRSGVDPATAATNPERADLPRVQVVGGNANKGQVGVFCGKTADKNRAIVFFDATGSTTEYDLDDICQVGR